MLEMVMTEKELFREIGNIKEEYDNLSLDEQIAKKLETELVNLGATVYVLPTDTQVIDHKERAHIAREHNADVFISIHANSVEAGYSSARGTQAYYYNSASYPLARSVVDKVEAVNSIGCGDAFFSGFIFAIINGMSEKEAIEIGKKVANITLLAEGAVNKELTKEKIL